MAKKKIEVNGLIISIEPVNNADYISLTDIARQVDKGAAKPDATINIWLKNRSTLEFLGVWEKLKNPDFKPHHLMGFKEKYLQNRNSITPKRWIEEMGAIGLVSKAGRGGGTYAHKDIALQFCGWLSPEFQVYTLLEFQRLKEEEFQQKNLEWHISKITDNIDEVRNLLDTIPHQHPQRNRLESPEDK